MTTAYAFDAANPSIDIRAMVRHGAIVAPVYIVGNPGGFPHVGKARVTALRAAGLAPLANWERAADFFRHCSIAEARAAGVEALVACRDLGIPDDGTKDVVFSFDYNIDPADYDAATARLIAAGQGLDGHYRARVYGPAGFLEYLAAHGQPGPHWLMASTFRATSQFHADEVGAPHVALVQSHTAAGNWLSSPIPGTDINTVVNPRALGAWWPDGSPYARGDQVSATDVIAALKSPEGQQLLQAALLNAKVDLADPAKDATLGQIIRAWHGWLSVDQGLLAAAADRKELAKAIAAALPTGATGLTADQLAAAVETGVRAVFADAATP